MTTQDTTEYTIDATGKRLGKVATEAATLLNGKNSPDFAKHILAPVKVIITRNEAEKDNAATH